MNTEIGHQPSNIWNVTEINTEKGHKQKGTLKLKLKTNRTLKIKYDNWNETEMGHQLKWDTNRTKTEMKLEWTLNWDTNRMTTELKMKRTLKWDTNQTIY